MFRKVIIKGFRGIKRLEIDDFKRINLFVGKNNCGKTTILESLFLLIAPTNVLLPVKINNLRGFTQAGEELFRILFNKLDIASAVKLSGNLINPGENRTLLIKPDTEFIPHIPGKIMDRGNYSGTEPVISGLNLEYTFKKNKELKKIITTVNTKLDGNLHISQGERYIEKRNGKLLTPEYILSDMPVNFDIIQKKKQVDKIINILKKLEPSLSNLSLGLQGIVYCDTGIDRLLPVNVMGAGLNRILAIIMTIINTPDGIVLIDEIENGLHYSCQKILWEAVFDAAKEFNVQVFATTHSIECVEALGNSYYSSDLAKDSIRLYRIERENDNFEAVTYEHKSLMSSIDGNWEVR